MTISEETLREAQEHLAIAIEASQMGTWSVDLSGGTCTHHNLRHHQIFGYNAPPGKWSIEIARNHLIPEDRPIFDNAFKRAMETGVLEFEARVQWPDGTIHWIGARGRYYFDAHGRPTRGCGVSFEITDRKRVEDALLQSEARHAFMLKLSDALRSLVDPIDIQAEATRVLGKYLKLDRVLYAEVRDGSYWVYGQQFDTGSSSPMEHGPYSAAEYGSGTFDSLKAGHTIPISNYQTDPRVPEAERATFAQLQYAASVGVPLIKQGQLVAVLVGLSRIPREWTNNEIELIEETAERTWDAVERGRSEVKLRISEEKYRVLFESIDSGFCVIEVLFDKSGRPFDYVFRDVNPSFEKQTGISEAIGRHMREIAPQHEEHWFEIYGQIAKTGQPTRFINRAEQLGRWYDVYAFRVGQPEENRVGVLFNDITQRKLVENELAKMRADLEARVRERTAELDKINEALRSEIAERQDLQRRLAGAEEQERHRISRELHDESVQLLSAMTLGLKALEPACTGKASAILKQLKDLARNMGRELHSLALKLRPTALDDIGLRSALANYVEEWSTRTNIPIDYHCRGLESERLPSNVESTLYRIVQESLNNIVKHAKARRVGVILERHEHHVLVVVEDDGIGFDADHLLISPRGTSLGLLGMKERAKLVEGTLSVESSPGRGTTILARIPLTSGKENLRD